MPGVTLNRTIFFNFHRSSNINPNWYIYIYIYNWFNFSLSKTRLSVQTNTPLKPGLGVHERGMIG